ncbi:MAG: hypothetical protein WC149_09960 [Arcobacteraceae bacterium]
MIKKIKEFNHISKEEIVKILRLYYLEKELNSLNQLTFFLIASIYSIPALIAFTSIMPIDQLILNLIFMNSEIVLKTEYNLANPIIIIFSVLAYLLGLFFYLYFFLLLRPKKHFIKKEIEKYGIVKKKFLLESSIISYIVAMLFLIPLVYTIWLMFTSNYIDIIEKRQIFPIKNCDFNNKVIIQDDYIAKIVQVNDTLYKCTKSWNPKNNNYIYKTYILNKDLAEKFLYEEIAY